MKCIIAALCILVVSVAAKRTKLECPEIIRNCDGTISKDVNVGAECKNGRYNLPVMRKVPIAITFQTNGIPVYAPRLAVTGAVYLNNQKMPPFPYVTVNGRNICSLVHPLGGAPTGGDICPLQPSQKYVYLDHFEVPPVNFLIKKVDVSWQILGERDGSKLTCVEIPVKLIQS